MVSIDDTTYLSVHESIHTLRKTEIVIYVHIYIYTLILGNCLESIYTYSTYYNYK